MKPIVSMAALDRLTVTVLRPATTSKPSRPCSATPGIVLTTDTYTSVLSDLAYHAA
jgi:hypothetical protein